MENYNQAFARHKDAQTEIEDLFNLTPSCKDLFCGVSWIPPDIVTSRFGYEKDGLDPEEDIAQRCPYDKQKSFGENLPAG